VKKRILHRKISAILTARVFRIASGADAEDAREKAAVAMKKIISQCLCLAVMTVSAVAAERAPSRVLRVSDPNPPVVCQDSMETEPATDDLEPVLILAADVNCKVPQMPIHV
jgi:hypothetical protein